MSNLPEFWLRGPLEDIPALVQPIAHALLQARLEVNELMSDFPAELLWERPVELASVGFHLQHMAGVLDRLFTYADGNQLSQEQMQYLRAEGNVPDGEYTTETLVKRFGDKVETCLVKLRSVNEGQLTERRGVGRKDLPSTVIGLYTHAAEHIMRHVGQLLVTSRIVKDKYAGETDARLIT